MHTESQLSCGPISSATKAALQDRWLLQSMRAIRIASITGILILNLRFVVLEIGWATQWEIIAFLAMLATIVPATLYRPVLGPLFAFPLVMVLAHLQRIGIFFSPQALLFPFVAAAFVWFAVRLVRKPAVLFEITPYGWLADCFGLALLAKILISLASPSLVNGVWAATLIPQDIWMSEFQALNVGFLLANGLLAFQILSIEMRGQQRLFGALLAVELVLLASSALVRWLIGLLGKVVVGGALEAGLFGVATGFAATREGPGWHQWSRALVLGLAAFFVAITMVKSAWLAAILILCFGVAYRFRLRGLAVLLAVVAAGFFFLRSAKDDLRQEGNVLSERLGKFVHPEQWHEQRNNTARINLYRKAWDFIKERPLDGVGVGDFRISETQKSREILGGMPRVEQNLHDAHNFLLNFGSEMGVPAMLLFMAILAVPVFTCLRGIAQGDADAWMLSSLLGIFGFFFVNLFNCLIMWPYQALFMGQFLAMPYAAKRFLSPDRPTLSAGLGPAKWKFWAPLLPVLLIVAAAPFSVSGDSRIQARSAGNFHWQWWHDGLTFSILPEVIFQLAAEDNVRAIEIIPIEGRLPKKGAKIRVSVEGQEVYVGKPPKSGPLIIPIRPKFDNRFAEIRLSSPAPWESWRMPSSLGLVETARIRLLGDNGPVDPTKLVSER